MCGFNAKRYLEYETLTIGVLKWGLFCNAISIQAFLIPREPDLSSKPPISHKNFF